MHFTVKLTAQALSTQAGLEGKFTEISSHRGLAGLKSLGSDASVKSAQTTTNNLRQAAALDKAASPQAEKQSASPVPPKAPRLR